MRHKVFVVAFAGLFVAGAIAARAAGGFQATSTTQSLGSIQIPHAVMADGKTLPAGTYSVRLTNDTLQPVTGQDPAAERWVEFVQGTTVKGREVASVVSKEDMKKMAKGNQPSSGGDLVELLVGNDYLRVWINKGGVNYLIHLRNPAPKK